MNSLRAIVAAALVPAALLGTACGRRDVSDAQRAADSAATRDIAFATQDSASQPALRDRPEAAPRPTTHARTSSTAHPKHSAGSTTAPSRVDSTITPSGNIVTTTQAGSEKPVATIPAGTPISLTAGQRVCMSTSKAGDTFTANTSGDIGTDAGVTVPSGSPVTIEVTSFDKSSNATQPIKMTFHVRDVSYGGRTYPLSAEITNVQVDKVRTTSTTSDAAKVAGGAVVGAILGKVIGHNTTSTVIGAAAGGAAGTAVAMGTGSYEGCIPQGGKIDIKTNAPVSVQ